ncbi:peptidylprolyl isomerase [Sulfuritalea hydrogenivorans]|jgi:peptidyl-prolyl cis-trans isomerase A (cyclophilin A)|uniref:Peptidyl-prolyl cis-trans isomerase n=1 Tax=Sulfuritalea hydrogenivorans sk43H TaxID=1223802 RepID=W0SD14_9PROT|nr:peptidylprolyl isomerase [Sulfuritalea hydrogenivorans]BAO29114.1 peptidyl-prolyl cis-trans isomerase [Sulfuritalea hydrogenivorans sk43H]
MHRLFLFVFALLFGIAAHAANPMLEVKTSQGTLTIELYQDKAPKTVENFLQYAKDGFFNGTIFHRVIPGFMIQGGGFTPDMKQKETRANIQNEAKNGLKNETGTLAMARTMDPHSASAQFFINLKDNSFLDYPGRDGWGYAVFGKVVQGFDVVQKIATVQTTNAGPHQNVPATPILIESVKLLPAPVPAPAKK